MQLDASERVTRALAKNTSQLVLLLGGSGVLEYASPAAAALIGYEPAEIVGRPITEFAHPDEIAAARTLLDAVADPAHPPVLSPSALSAIEWQLRHRDGHYVTVDASGESFLSDPEVAGILVVLNDRSLRRQYADVLEEFATSGVTAAGYDVLLDLVESQIGDGAASLFIAGQWPEWIQHGVHAELCPPAGIGPWLAAVEAGQNVIVEDFEGAVAAEIMSEELAYVARRAGYLSCWCIAVPTSRLDEPTRLVRDILGCMVVWSSSRLHPNSNDEHVLARAAGLADLGLRRRQGELELRWAAAHDDLTGVMNRGGITRAITDLGRPGAYMLLDFDGFREINDEHGHTLGDTILQALVDRLRNAVRGDDLVGRLSGDKFVVFLPDATTRSATAAADRLIEIFLQPIVVGDLELTVSASIGIDCSATGGPNEQLERADRSLYVAKRAGRGRIAIWAEDSEEE